MDSNDDWSNPPRRDVRCHLLFEIATEVANRGEFLFQGSQFMSSTNSSEYGPLIRIGSWRDLFCSEIKGSCDHSRIWRAIYSDRTAQPVFGAWIPSGLYEKGTSFRFANVKPCIGSCRG